MSPLSLVYYYTVQYFDLNIMLNQIDFYFAVGGETAFWNLANQKLWQILLLAAQALKMKSILYLIT